MGTHGPSSPLGFPCNYCAIFPGVSLFCSSAENFLTVQFACSSQSLSSYASLHLGSLLSLPPVRCLPQLILWETRLWVHTNTFLSLVWVVTWKQSSTTFHAVHFHYSLSPQLFINASSVVGSFSGGAVVKNPPANAGDSRDTGSFPGSGRSPGVGNGNLLQYSCLGNPLDRGACQASVRGVAKSQTQLCYYWARMSTHASIAWILKSRDLQPPGSNAWWSEVELM